MGVPVNPKMIMLKGFDDLTVHIAKLRAVALIKDDHHMLFKDLVPFIFGDENIQLLDGGDDDMR